MPNSSRPASYSPPPPPPRPYPDDGAAYDGGPDGRNAGAGPRRGRSSAALTFSRRPPTSRLWKRVMASAASLGLGELDERESARPAGLAIGRQVHVDDAPRFGEQRRQLLLGGAEIQIAYKNLRRNGSSFPADNRRLNSRAHIRSIGNAQEGTRIRGRNPCDRAVRDVRDTGRVLRVCDQPRRSRCTRACRRSPAALTAPQSQASSTAETPRM